MKMTHDGLILKGDSLPLKILKQFIEDGEKHDCTDFEIAIERHNQVTTTVLKITKEV